MRNNKWYGHSITKEKGIMEMKSKREKVPVQGSILLKINAHSYPCLHVGTRNPCSYHCKKCYFEIMYCHRN